MNEEHLEGHFEEAHSAVWHLVANRGGVRERLRAAVIELQVRCGVPHPERTRQPQTAGPV